MKWRGKREHKKPNVEWLVPKFFERQFLPFRSSLDICIYIYIYIHTPFVFFCSMYHHVSRAGFFRWQAHHDCRRGGATRLEPCSLYQSPQENLSSKVNHVPQPNVGIYIYHTWILWVLNESLFTPLKNNMDTTKIPHSWKENPLNEQKHINFFGFHIGFRECNYFLHTFFSAHGARQEALLGMDRSKGQGDLTGWNLAWSHGNGFRNPRFCWRFLIGKQIKIYIFPWFCKIFFWGMLEYSIICT